MRPTLSKWTVGVMGSSSVAHEDDAAEIGRLLAQLEVNLLTGGGGGAMRAVAQAFLFHRHGAGISIGILPCANEHDRSTPRSGYPNPFVELAIQTHLPRSGSEGTDDLSRNHINILSCGAVIVLPGGAGTASELALAMRYGRPAIAYSKELSQLESVPSSVTRTSASDDVEHFVRKALGIE